MYEIHQLSLQWSLVPTETYLEVARARPPGLGKDPRFLELQREMRACVPVPGEDWVHDIDVLIEPHQADHQGQRWHQHPEWTAIYYVSIGSPPVPLRIRTQYEETEIFPDPGDCVVLQPNVDHKVAASSSLEPRLSFAMLVEAPGSVSKFRK